MVDFHSHILPAMDDGSADVEMSLAMLRKEAEQGVHTVVATPHFYAIEHTPEAFLAARQRAMEQLEEAVKAEPGLPQVIVGAEVAYFRGMSDSEAMWDLRIADTNCILVELPMAPWKDHVYEELSGLAAKQNLLPIVAHVDRYLPPLRGRKLVDRLLEKQVLIQANASFFLGKQAKAANKLLKAGKIHLLGSDCHNLAERAPNLGAVTLDAEDLAHIRYYQNLVLNEETM